MEILYKATAVTEGGGDGRVRSSDNRIDMKLSTPKEMGGQGGDGTNPEQLFSAGYSACLSSAIGFVARQEKLSLKSMAVQVETGIGPNGKGGFIFSLVIDVTLGGLSQAKAEELVKKAHLVCPFSNSTAGNVKLQERVLVK
ncbi:MAG: organic hydroperoxide resistance protein [Culturomica sp.]|jgi:Ohr subfamily peroxiredoxin|nr:organic hydroperoxide resistance protein [Culturomica sp.]